jgi:2-(1,2-epoxy-1,2-dihydrophenyl)acetyl-CoA isomerase
MTHPGDPPVLYRRDEHVARIHFNRPQALNAIDVATAAAFEKACLRLHEDRDVRVVVISAEGRAFVAGGDIKVLQSNPGSVVGGLLEPMHRSLCVLTALPAPVIACVQGIAAGAGFSLAMACDLVIATREARFSWAYLQVGASCDLGASWTLPSIVGLRKALEIALLGDTIDAAEALRIGLVNRVVSPSELQAATEALAARIATSSPVAVANMKRLLRESQRKNFSEQLAAEKQAFSACMETADFSSAVRRFMER